MGQFARNIYPIVGYSLGLKFGLLSRAWIWVVWEWSFWNLVFTWLFLGRWDPRAVVAEGHDEGDVGGYGGGCTGNRRETVCCAADSPR